MNEIIMLNEQEFINKYWYASELKVLARSLGIVNVGKFRKNELEEIILKYFKTGKLIIPNKIQKIHNNNAEDTLTLKSTIKNYKNNKRTWNFITIEACKLQPNFKDKSGAKYWLNRWRENKVQKGIKITYGDLVNEYIRLNHIDRLPQIPSAKFNNFISDYLKNETGKNRTDAINAWDKLKQMNVPKDYDSWKNG